MFSLIDLTDPWILYKIVALFSPTSSFRHCLTHSSLISCKNINNDFILFHLVARIFSSQFLHYWTIFLCLLHLFYFAVIKNKGSSFQWLTLGCALCQLFWRRFCWPYPDPASTYGTLSGDLPHIRHMTFEVSLPFPVFLWWYNLVGNICWYNSCMAATISVGTDLQLLIRAKQPPTVKGRVLQSIFSQFSLPFLFS